MILDYISTVSALQTFALVMLNRYLLTSEVNGDQQLIAKISLQLYKDFERQDAINV
jgi:hypothetical protein